MALTVPDEEDLRQYARATSWQSTEEQEFAEVCLQRATDLMTIATGLEEDPMSDLMLRLVQTGILAMAFALLVRSEDRAAIYSPFASERIGSYSYSKAVAQATKGRSTGVEEFDAAVEYVAGESDGSTSGWSSSQDVFSQPLAAFDPPFSPIVFPYSYPEGPTPGSDTTGR